MLTSSVYTKTSHSSKKSWHRAAFPKNDFLSIIAAIMFHS
jgi:hypothetical protein